MAEAGGLADGSEGWHGQTRPTPTATECHPGAPSSWVDRTAKRYRRVEDGGARVAAGRVGCGGPRRRRTRALCEPSAADESCSDDLLMWHRRAQRDTRGARGSAV